MAVRFKLNSKGVASILLGKTGRVTPDLTRRANAVATAADGATGRAGDHAVEVTVGRNRVRAVVYTDTFNAMHREAESRTLTRSVDAGRA